MPWYLAALLTGQLPVSRGEVRLDQRNVMEWSEHELFQRIALLPQRSTLLSASLADNLRLANPQLSDQRLRAALEATGLGYLADDPDQWVGLNGRALSGGEARRIALVRCMLTERDALILDEPLRGLDLLARRRVLDWILSEQRGRTLILLDHQSPQGFQADISLALT